MPHAHIPGPGPKRQMTTLNEVLMLTMYRAIAPDALDPIPHLPGERDRHGGGRGRGRCDLPPSSP